MIRFITHNEPLVAAVMAVSLAASLVLTGTRPTLPEAAAPQPVTAALQQSVAVTGPLHLCTLRVPSWDQPKVVAWQRGRELMVAPAREFGGLPGALHAPSGQAIWRVPLQPWLGFVPQGDGGGQVLRLPGIALDCVSTAED